MKSLVVSVFSLLFLMTVLSCQLYEVDGDGGDHFAFTVCGRVTTPSGEPLPMVLIPSLSFGWSDDEQTDNEGSYCLGYHRLGDGGKEYYEVVPRKAMYVFSPEKVTGWARDNDVIRNIDFVGTFAPMLTTRAGKVGVFGFADANGEDARFNFMTDGFPNGIAIDDQEAFAYGTLFLADSGNHVVRSMSIDSGAVSTLAGSPEIAGSEDGSGPAARFSSPAGLCMGDSHLFVADRGNCTIRKISLVSGAVTTLAGSAGLCAFADGDGPEARFNSPTGIATDGESLYVGDSGNHVVRRIDIATGKVTTLAGSADNPGAADGIGDLAKFNAVGPVTIDGDYLYVADVLNHTVRKIVIGTGTVTTLAGTAGLSGAIDDIGSAARFSHISDIAMDGDYLYLTDLQNHTVRRIELATDRVTTLAGLAGSAGSADGNTIARFDSPVGIAVAGGTLFVLDGGNATVRWIH